jgi:DNA invertase Pin-like site-specific DNA recombinase
MEQWSRDLSVHGYCRAALFGHGQSVEAQKAAIRDHAQAHALLPEPPSDGGLPPSEDVLWYVDAAGAGKHKLRDREAGGVLLRNVRPGDSVVVSRLDRAFRRLKDFVEVLDDLERRRVHLRVCELLGRPVDFSKWGPRALVAMLDGFGQLDRDSRAERTGEASRGRRERGLGLGHPRLGHKYQPRYRRLKNGRMRRYLVQVADPDERAVMNLIVGWRQQDPPWSYDQIRQKLNYELKLRTRTGREWSEARIRRACVAAAVLQQKEADIERIRSEIRRELAGPTQATDEGRDQTGGPG